MVVIVVVASSFFPTAFESRRFMELSTSSSSPRCGSNGGFGGEEEREREEREREELEEERKSRRRVSFLKKRESLSPKLTFLFSLLSLSIRLFLTKWSTSRTVTRPKLLRLLLQPREGGQQGERAPRGPLERKKRSRLRRPCSSTAAPPALATTERKTSSPLTALHSMLVLVLVLVLL